jgi:hypothetical protein
VTPTFQQQHGLQHDVTTEAARKHIQRCVERMQATGNPTPQRPQHPGPDHKVPDEVVMEIANRMAYIGCYTSMDDAMRYDSYIRCICQEYDVDMHHLLRRIHEVDEDFARCVHIELVPHIKPDLKNERLLHARTMRGMIGFLLENLVFIDAKTMDDELPHTQMAWGHKGPRGAHHHVLREHPAMRLHGANTPPRIRLKYYAAVSASKGPIYIKFTSGTTGLDLGYKVSTWPGQQLITTAV